MFHLRAFTRRLATPALVLAVLATPFASSAADPYTIDPTFFARVDWAVDQAQQRGLTIIVDVHHYLVDRAVHH